MFFQFYVFLCLYEVNDGRRHIERNYLKSTEMPAKLPTSHHVMFYECDTESQLAISHKDGKLFLFGLYIVIHDFYNPRQPFRLFPGARVYPLNLVRFLNIYSHTLIVLNFCRYSIFKHHRLIFAFREFLIKTNG